MSNQKLINKITPGYVIQTYDYGQHKYVSQEFVAADDVIYEYVDGTEGLPINYSTLCQLDSAFEKDAPYLCYDMIQPE